MKKALATGLLLASASLSTHAEVSPFVGVSLHSITLSGDDVRPKSRFDKGGPTSETASNVGLLGGLYLSDSTRLVMQHYKTDDSNDLPNGAIAIVVTVTTFGVDYVFNSDNPHRGFFVGTGFSLIELENVANPKTQLNGNNKTDGSAIIFRGGYTHKFESGLFAEAGFNLRSAQIEHKVQTGNADKYGRRPINGQGDYTVKDFNLSIGYVF